MASSTCLRTRPSSWPHIIREAKSYLDGLPPPFFKALMDYAEDGSYSWHCPGHSGGVAFLKSPVGQMFHQFYGENMLRADVCNAVEELGQLLDHTGPVYESEKNAARIFNADHCFFVTNGTSTSNKMVWHHTVAPDDIVIVDRNCHKSILHSIIMTGAIPVFMTPTRNHFGIIGPIPQERVRACGHPQEDRQQPACSRAWTPDRQAAHHDAHADAPTTACSTTPRPSRACSTVGWTTLHFDEAWLPHAAFHPFDGAYHAMGKKRARPKEAVVYATQSIHKLLAGISQASQVLVQDSQNGKLDHHLFNEAYLMHTSTSPQYSIIASCDVAAAMMEPPGGTALVEESIMEALDFRRAMRKVDDEFGDDDWWFQVWGPKAGRRGRWPCGRLDHPRQGCAPKTGCKHKDGKKSTTGMALATWPTASTCWTRSSPPSSPRAGPVRATLPRPASPASIVTKYLAEHGVVVEKTGLYSFFIMFTIGITKGRWNTMLTALQQFKDDYDKQPAAGAHPARVLQEARRYERMGLR